jgi:hypothetical protein
MRLKITQGADTIVDIPDWDGPVPRMGEYIFHPPLEPGDFEGIAGCVKVVTWRTHDRVNGKFVKTRDPYVELAI